METFWFVFCATVFTIASLYILSFITISLPGVIQENIFQALKLQSVLNALQQKLPVIYTKEELSKIPDANTTNTLGGIIDGWRRKGQIIVTIHENGNYELTCPP